MADLTVVNPHTAAGVAPTSNALAGGGDRFATVRGRTYMLRFANASGGSLNAVLDDPTSGTGPPGATTPTNPDVTITVPAGTQRAYVAASDRFADANGWINMTYTGVTSFTCEIYGPFE